MKNYFIKLYENLKKNYKVIVTDLIFIVGFIVLCTYPLPYVIYRPGGLINLNDRIILDNDDKISGSYNMSYVTVARGNIPNLLLSLVINNWDIMKQEEALPYSEDYETNLEISRLDLQNSVDTAKLVAFQKAGYEVDVISKEIVVKSIDKSAKTDLEPLDHIVSLNGLKCKDIKDLRAFIGQYKLDEKIIIEVKNDEKIIQKYAYVYEYEERKVIGITFMEKYDYKTPVDIDFTNKASESGSSGGMMLTLMMYDALTNQDLTKGKTIVGTGTIDKNGNVGAIGGVKYKMLGAKNDADVYLVPKANCKEANEVYKKYKLNFQMQCVSTIDEAIGYLNSVK